jgi:glycosyltransferase involved in cell wall biosynthesis
VRVLIDYRPALRERSGAGEYTHQLVRALATQDTLELSLFSSSWKHRLTRPPGLDRVTIVDRRVPVSVLNFAWHRLGWPPAEWLTGRTYDVTHSSHPLILPSTYAAQVITIHDLNFLSHPERTRAEIRRDYPALARAHAHRADRILVPSAFTAAAVEQQLGVERSKIVVAPVGAPPWTPLARPPKDGYILFVGTLEPRKNVGGLLDAYERLIGATASSPPTATAYPDLVLAGRVTDDALDWLKRIERPPLKGRVRQIGYVDPTRTRALYEGARLLVLPSFEEGFGIPVLEAMTAGVPVVASQRGSLPEVLGDAGLLVDPERPDAIAAAMAQVLDDPAFAEACAARGIARSRAFRWDVTAARVGDAYREAAEAHAHRR